MGTEIYHSDMEEYICSHIETVGNNYLLSIWGESTEYNGYITVFFHNDEIRNITGLYI